MGPSLSRLRSVYDRAAGYTRDADPGALESHVSDFWAGILAERPSYPRFEAMLTMRRGATYPLGERRDLEDEEAELTYARAAAFVATRSIPAESGFLDGLEEPAFGCPRPFEFAGKQLTPNCLVNAITVYGVLEACRRAGLDGRPLRILEIGAGFGQAARLLIERLDVRTYAVCDLPENLFLSAFYLQALFPDREAAYVDETEDGAGPGLSFVLPSLAGRLAGPFDVVLNAYSFQEMKQASVDDYFALAGALLAPDGVFYSLNAHGKDEVRWPSEYPVGGFRLERLRSPRKFPFHLNPTVPYELVLRPFRDGERGGHPLLEVGLDGIGCAFQVGLDEELEGLCNRLVSESLAPGEASWLEALAGFFRAVGADDKRGHAETLRAAVLPGAGSYLGGSLAYACGDAAEAARLLADGLPGLGSSLARVHSETMLATLTQNESEARAARVRASELAPHLADQIEATVLNPVAYAGHVGDRLRLSPPPGPVALGGRLRRSARRIRDQHPRAT